MSRVHGDESRSRGPTCRRSTLPRSVSRTHGRTVSGGRGPRRRQPRIGRRAAQFRGVCRAADLPAFTPHELRHTFASLQLQAGTDVYYVQAQLGHAGIDLTVNTYGSWLKTDRRATLDALETGRHPRPIRQKARSHDRVHPGC